MEIFQFLLFTTGVNNHNLFQHTIFKDMAELQIPLDSIVGYQMQLV